MDIGLMLAAVGEEPTLAGWLFWTVPGMVWASAAGLTFVIFVHELGHFLVAKACGVKCEKFYVGFDFFEFRFRSRSGRFRGRWSSFSGAKRNMAWAACRWAAT